LRELNGKGSKAQQKTKYRTSHMGGAGWAGREKLKKKNRVTWDLRVVRKVAGALGKEKSGR